MWLLQNEKQAFLRWVTRKNQKTLTYTRIKRVEKITGRQEGYLPGEPPGAIGKAFAGEQRVILVQRALAICLPC